MSHFFQKPENVLKRARELIAIPNVDDAVRKRTKRTALEILHDALSTRKNRVWQPVHEEIMMLYLDTCLDLQLGRIAKDGLHQYRNLSIQHNSASLENVILHFVKIAEQKLLTAKQESNDLIILAAAKVDLEAAQTPEAVMLSTTTHDDSSDRTDREVVVPWLRFVWETFRTVLDILKSNSKLEVLYKNIAMKAFDFCVEYTRKIEFRRLCEILRNHLSNLQRHASAPTSLSTRQMRSWDGFTLDSVELLLEMRYRQLQVATQLELFSEAFRTIDDINTIMNLVEQVPRLELMVTYYEKLAQIFLVSKNYLFHAYALYKWYCLRVGGLEGIDGGVSLAAIKSLVPDEEQNAMATQVVLATLSIPLVDFEMSSPILDEETTSTSDNSVESMQSAAMREKNARMAALLGYSSTPSRAQLLEEIAVAQITKKASAEVTALYQHLEREDVNPLHIVQQVLPYLEKLRDIALKEPSYKTYVDSVERLLVRRVLFQLTRVYSSVTIGHLKSLFVGLNVTYQEIEQLIVRSRSLSTVAHVSAPSLSSMYLKDQQPAVDASTSALRTKIRIDHIQQCIRFSDSIEMEANPAQLSLLGERLQRVMKKVQYEQDREAAIKNEKLLFDQARSNFKSTRRAMLERKQIIERKKEELEHLQQEKMKTIEKKRLEYEQMRQQMEKDRLEQEAKRREMEKVQKFKDEIALKETRQLLERIGHKDLDNIDLETVDREKLMDEAKEKAQRVKEEAQRKLQEAARRLDYIIRATREVEQPILQKQFAGAKTAAKKQYEQSKEAKLKQAKEEHEFGLKEKARLAAAHNVLSGFVEGHVMRRKEEYKRASEEHKKKAMLERLESKVANAKERYEEEQDRLREIEEEKERKRIEEEEERERERQREIDEALRREEEEEKRRAEEEREKKLDREREQEQERSRESSSRFGGDRMGSDRPQGRRDDGEWTSVGPSGRTSAAPEGRWERSGPPPTREREPSSRFGGFGDRDREPRRFGDREREPSSRFGGDREREPSSRFGGDREREPSSRFGGDREREPSSRFGGDREREPSSRFGGDREREPSSRFGDREREPSSRFGGGDRDREPRRFGVGDRDREPRRFGGDRSTEESGSMWRRSGGDNDREAPAARRLDRGGGDDRFSSRREGAYRPPRGADREREAGDSTPAREQTRAPESGRWRK